jgi:hypothetical protein
MIAHAALRPQDAFLKTTEPRAARRERSCLRRREQFTKAAQ